MKILVLDDSQERLKAFQKKLIGHIVVLVETAQEAIDQLDINGPFDMCFLDHDLGGLSMVESGPGTGYEVAVWLAEHPKKQPQQIIIHSFNEPASRRMLKVLPNAVHQPGAWTQITYIG